MVGIDQLVQPQVVEQLVVGFAPGIPDDVGINMPQWCPVGVVSAKGLKYAAFSFLAKLMSFISSEHVVQ